MSEPNTKIKFTYQDYKSLPYHETKQYELLGGELIMVPSPTEPHQRISGNLEFLLRQFVKERKLGHVYDAPLDVVLGQGEDREVAQPDIFYISSQRSSIITEEEIRGAPDLIIEIISPGTEKYDRGYKRSLYARHGVKEYWIADPDQKAIEVFTLTESGFETKATYGESETLTSPLLEGLTIDLTNVF